MKRIGIVGGTGYTGVELLRMLATHSGVEVTCLTSRSEAGKTVASLYPWLSHYGQLSFEEPSIEALSDCDLVFYA
ncbi:MAG: N-acetyl-gamma-glutamyl-phosphate reductase, partial [Gammaproteobacteria bacterium]|nr:N-acetyl-gamma-glutamyl-phosphate reductase [Gammaproteobacteria bacterium]